MPQRFSTKTIVLIFLLLPLLFIAATPAGRSNRKPKVIVLGFDGADARHVQQWMDEGKLPNMARLRAMGTYRPLRPTIPAQTPVSWSTFSTGIDPGRTGIFDFLRRDPKNYLPVFAAIDEQSEPFLFGKNNRWVAAAVVFALVFLLITLLARIKARWATAAMIALIPALIAGWGAQWFAATYLPLTRPLVVNRRQGIPFWDVAAKAGFKTQVVRVPVTFPATEIASGGHMFSGLGVPDISGRVGKPFYFTSELNLPQASANEFSIEVVQLEDNRGVIHTTVVGPPNKLFKEPKYIAQPMNIVVGEDRKSVVIELGEQKISLRPGQWSNWADFTFAFNSIIKVHGISRFYLLESEPEVKLYLSPINFDPRQLPPGFKITSPEGWAPELAREFGPFKTMGWAIDTWAISEGFANEQIFWDDMTWTVAKFRKMFNGYLAANDYDLLVQVFEFPDRVGHVFWRLIDPGHPAYDAKLAAKWGGGLLQSYQIMDGIVGEAMAAAEKNDAALIVLSDHGFTTWRKSINYNTWLVQNGYMTLKSGVEVKARNLEILFDHGEFWENVDWSHTRAYAMGLGDMYINLRGREAQGIVAPGAEYESLRAELKQKLETIVDPENGEHPVSRVYTREEAYSGFDPNLVPDLFVTNSEGYRVSWQTSLGGIQKNLIEENKRVWSGDHCSVNPELVKGIFFYNRKLQTDRSPYIADVYATVLKLMGLTAPYRLDGVALQ
ncbi:MAG: alkaline phosphatase family protein [Acidobacteriota bacterium]